MPDILLAPASTAPASGTPGVLFGNLFVPLGMTGAPAMPSAGLVFHASLAAASETAETRQALTVGGDVSFVTLDGVPCARFGGGEAYIHFPDTGLPAGNAARTLVCWYHAAADAQGDMICVEYGSNTGELLSNLFVYPDSRQIEVGRRGATVTSDAGSANLDGWSLVAATFDGSVATLYHNAHAIKSGSFSFNTQLSRGYIGYREDYGQLTGYIAGVRIYSRALSASEIATLAMEYRR